LPFKGKKKPKTLEVIVLKIEREVCKPESTVIHGGL
jgi:hypothetical protein